MLLILGSCGAQDVGYQPRIGVGKQMLLNGQLSRGYRLLDAVEADHKESAKVQIALGEAYLDAAAFLKSEAAFNKAIKRGESRAGTLGLGRVALARNNHRKAKTYFSSVLEKDADNLVALNGLGVAHDLAGNHIQARLHYQQVLDIDPVNLDSINNMGLSLALNGDAQQAIKLLTDLTRSQLDDATARQNLALAHGAAGQRKQALRLAEADITRAQAQTMMKAIASYRRTRR